MLDLTKDYDCYLFALILADGSLYFTTRNRGKVQIELNYGDKDIIESIHSRFHLKSYINSRTRQTTFKNNYKTIIWSCYQLAFREQLIELGIPKRDKSDLGNIPLSKYNKRAFWRGYIDGDGSIGMTSNDEPYISVIMKSKSLAKSYLNFLQEEFNIIKIINPNKRDNAYNIVVKNEDAINLGNYIYAKSTIHLMRKYNNYLKIKDWIRRRPKVNSRTWTFEEDSYILTHGVEESMAKLDRTESSIETRLWRLKTNKTNYIDSNK